MPKAPVQSRQRPVSCTFCRARKLRCSRVSPCSNCSSRGVSCCFDSPLDQPSIVTISTLTPSSTTASSSGADADAVLCDVLERLKRIEEMLGQRESLSATWNSQSPGIGLAGPGTGVERAVVNSGVYGGQAPSGLDSIVYSISPISAVLKAHSHIIAGTEKTKLIWLPTYQEATALVEKYIESYSFVQHVVYTPSLPAILTSIYLNLNDPSATNTGHMTLLLSIIASSTFAWTDEDTYTSTPPSNATFPSADEAFSQTSFWIAQTLDLIDLARRSSYTSLELLQGILVLSFVIANLEGVSIRYRSLLSHALFLGREMGLHRQDYLRGNEKVYGVVETEIRRRVWWYIVTTDWFLAARYSGPTEGVYACHTQHMSVNLPLHINDADLEDKYRTPLSKPLSEATQMSYFLQRIRLATITRGIVDRQHRLDQDEEQSAGPTYDDILAIDTQLYVFLTETPPFFYFDGNGNPEGELSDNQRDPHILIQAYLLTTLVHTQRCKLHLPYLISHSSATFPSSSLSTQPHTDATYSRHTCLTSAHAIIAAELRLEKLHHPFVSSRLKSSGILYGVFMATIVLLMDACTRSPSVLVKELSAEHSSTTPIGQALRILREARNKAPAARRLLDDLMRVLRRVENEGGRRDDINSNANTAAVLRGLLATATTTTIQNGDVGEVLGYEETPCRGDVTRDGDCGSDQSGASLSHSLNHGEVVNGVAERIEQFDGLPECLDLWGSEFGGLRWGELFEELDVALL